jgi:hypothetical protein
MSIINCVPQERPQGVVEITDCTKSYSVNDGNCGFRFPEEGEVLAPWVAIDFVDLATLSVDGANAAITVSNFSSTSTNPANCAVIKSFSLGGSNGLDVRVTIHDTQGGSFAEFMKHICGDWLCLNGNTSNIIMKVQFGWAKNSCGTALPRNASPCYYVIVTKVDANFTEGKFSFDIIGNDTAMMSFYGGIEDLDGGEGNNGMHLVHALHKLWCDSCAPTIGNLSFNLVQGGQSTNYQYDPNSTPEQAKVAPEIFSAKTLVERQFGPKGKWACNGEDKMAATRRWIAETKSINDKPWDVKFNVNDPTGQLQFWEITKPKEKSEDDAFFNELCIGTYIVNGGKMSPVLEFNPKISWNFALLVATGGNTGDLKLDSMGTQGAKNPGEESMPRERYCGAGQVTMTNPSDGQKDREGAQSVKDAAEVEALAKKGINIEAYDNITADLVIVGNPNLWPPWESRSKTVTIVMINPFHLIPNSGNNAEWMAKPECNEVLSNKGWFIESVNHQIDAGKYVTTLGVKLPTPGVDLPSGERFGGWNRGWKPVTCG